jgi:hypothetical protein
MSLGRLLSLSLSLSSLKTSLAFSGFIKILQISWYSNIGCLNDLRNVRKNGRSKNLELELMKDCASIFDKISTSDEENRKTLKKICNLLNIIIKPIEFKVKNKATLHHIIFTIIFLSSKFNCFSEIRAAIKNRKILDLFMLYNNIGIIIELKFKTAAEEGLKQIKTNCYVDAFRSDKYNPENKKIDYFLLIGLSMSEEQEITLSVLLNNLNLRKKEFFSCN